MNSISKALLAATAAILPAFSAPLPDPAQSFISKNCIGCHGSKLSTAGLNLEALTAANDLQKDRDRWELVASRIESGEMPPKGLPRPDPAAAKSLTDFLKADFARQDKLIRPDPGHITARRLNRAEYNNTIRDLLAVDYRPAADFPQDDSGYGFDNIGDVLSLSPVLMEKYLSAAEKVSRMAIYGDQVPKPTNVHYQPFLRRPGAPPSLFEYDEDGFSLPSAFNVQHRFPADAEYLLKITLNGQRPPGSEPVNIAVWIDGKQIQQFRIDQNDMEGQSRQFRTTITKGDHLMSVTFLKQFEGLPASLKGPNPSKKSAPPGRGGRGPMPVADPNEPVAAGGRGTAAPAPRPPASYAGRVEALDIGGPFDAKPEPPTASLRQIFTCGHADGHHTAACPRKILSDFERRAYRRPVSPAEVNQLVALYSKVRNRGDSFNEGIATAIQYVLVSPDFLFRIEKDPQSAAHPVASVRTCLQALLLPLEQHAR